MILVLASACARTASDAVTDDRPGAAVLENDDDGNAVSVRLESVTAEPAPDIQDGAWSFEATQRDIAVRVVLSGRGEARSAIAVVDDHGREIYSDVRQVALDGRAELAFPDLRLPDRGGYRLTLEVTAPGVRHQSVIAMRVR